MLVSSENSEPASAAPRDPGSGASATIAPMCRAGIGGIDHGLDADQLQALRALRQEERRRTGQPIVGTSSDRPIHATGSLVRAVDR